MAELVPLHCSWLNWWGTGGSAREWKRLQFHPKEVESFCTSKTKDQNTDRPVADSNGWLDEWIRSQCRSPKSSNSTWNDDLILPLKSPTPGKNFIYSWFGPSQQMYSGWVIFLCVNPYIWNFSRFIVRCVKMSGVPTRVNVANICLLSSKSSNLSNWAGPLHCVCGADGFLMEVMQLAVKYTLTKKSVVMFWCVKMKF